MTLDPAAVEARLAEMDRDIALAEHLVEYLDHQRHKARVLEAIKTHRAEATP